jgi:acyl carrier protein
MEITDFIEKLEVEFEEIEKGTLNSTTNFRDIDEWSSMHALIIIALIDVEYEVTVKGEDLVKMETIQDLFDFVKQNHNL